MPACMASHSASATPALSRLPARPYEQAPWPPCSLQAQRCGNHTAPRHPQRRGAAGQRARHGPRCWRWPPGGGGSGPSTSRRPLRARCPARRSDGRRWREGAERWAGEQVEVGGLPTGRDGGDVAAGRCMPLGKTGLGCPLLVL